MSRGRKSLSSLFKSDELDRNKTLIGLQLVSIVILICTFVFWVIFEQFKSDFFNFKDYWYRTDNLFGSVFSYWPLFVWGGLMAFVSCFNIRSYFKAKEIFATDIITSVLAGIWEELGYRCVFILTAMIGIVVSNFFWFWLMLLILIIICIAILTSLEATLSRIITVIVFLIMIAGLFMLDLKDPIYWMYNHIIFPILNLVSFHQLRPVLYHESLPFLFIAGAVSANAKFRDGHKYLGPIGQLNAWVIGYVLLHAMIFHGLVVAIICHSIYDLEFGFIRFGFRGINGKVRGE